MELKKNKNGVIEYMMKSGKDLVAATMPATSAELIIASGEVKEYDEGHMIVDGKFIFPAVVEKKEEPKKKR